MPNLIVFPGDGSDEFSENLAKKIVRMLSEAKRTEPTPPSSQEDILFKSLQEAADFYGVCYQTISKHLESIPHLTFGRAIRLYKSHIDAAIIKDNIFSKRKGNRK